MKYLNKRKTISTKDLYLLQFKEVVSREDIPSERLLDSTIKYREKR